MIVSHVLFCLAAGNMWHLIVEACIARNLLDTSAYLWPGYVNVARSNQVPHSVPGQSSGWSSLMKGSPLTPSLINALVATPASRYNISCVSYFFSFFRFETWGGFKKSRLRCSISSFAALKKYYHTKEPPWWLKSISKSKACPS
jgi:hypothetical protein